MLHMSGDKNHLRRNFQTTHKLKSIRSRHADIEENHIRFSLPNHAGGLFHPSGLTDDVHPSHFFEEGAESLASQALVIHQDYAKHGAPSNFRTARTRPASSAR